MGMRTEVNLPIALSASVLLDLSWICVRVSVFGEVAGEMLVLVSRAVGETSMVTVRELVGASHYPIH